MVSSAVGLKEGFVLSLNFPSRIQRPTAVVFQAAAIVFRKALPYVIFKDAYAATLTSA